MARVVLIGMYDNWTLGLRTLANALLSKGHFVSILHFKLPAMYNKPFFLKYTRQYQTLNTLHARDKIVVQWYNTDAVMWTHNEIHLLGDLLEKLNPDIIGISTRSAYEKDIFDLTDQMRRVPGALTVAGGHDASFRPENYVDHVNYVCVGEGEEALVGLAEAVDSKISPKDIPGLVYRENSNIVRNPMSLPNTIEDYFFREDMDRIDHYLVENNHIHKVDYLFRDVTFPANDKNYFTFVGRGCPGMCTFCSAGQFQRLYHEYGHILKSRRMRPIENVIREMLFAKRKGFNKVYFLDSFLLASKRYLLSFFDAYEKSDGLPFFAQLHPEQVLKHPEILDAAVSAGMNEIVIGIQSGSERVNREVFNRKTSHSQILRFAEMCVQRGNLKLDYHLITHNPFEVEEDFIETLDFIGKLPRKNTYLVLRPLYAFPNTNIHRMIQEQKPEAINNEVHYKLLMLYLFRYSFPCHEFNKIQSKFSEMSIPDLICAYEELKKIYKNEHSWVIDGEGLFKSNKINEAITYFDEALKLNHNYYKALKGKGLACFVKGRLTQAEHYLRKALSEYPKGDKEVWKCMGEVMLKQRRFGEALSFYAKAERIVSPYYRREYGQILLRLGYIHSELGQLKQTREYCNRALEFLDTQERLEVERLISQITVKNHDCRIVTQPVRDSSQQLAGWCQGRSPNP